MFHSLADTRDIVFWTPRGQLLRNKHIIPVTDIADLVEYVLLPHNDDITKPLNLIGERGRGGEDSYCEWQAS